MQNEHVTLQIEEKIKADENIYQDCNKEQKRHQGLGKKKRPPALWAPNSYENGGKGKLVSLSQKGIS